MTERARTYSGSVEAFTLDEVAVRLRVTRQWVESHYTGPRIKLGRETRVSAKHLDTWLDELAGLSAEPVANAGGRVRVA